uniref:Uncharacterized protein n=1 Tax=Amphimedon queenslandica TaxID=400682 RepID=A0A1X7TE22_AMPQE
MVSKPSHNIRHKNHQYQPTNDRPHHNRYKSLTSAILIAIRTLVTKAFTVSVSLYPQLLDTEAESKIRSTGISRGVHL